MPSPAPPASEAILLEHESQFCYAVQSILAAAGFADVRLPGDAAALKDETCLVKFTRGPATGGETLKPDGEREYNQWSGSRLVILYCLRRDQNIASDQVGLLNRLAEKRGLIRAAFQKSAHPFTIGTLPWQSVTDIQPGAAGQSVDTSNDRNYDLASEEFLITHQILDEAWPV